jgi:S1-C subfamily serine protease
MKIRYTIWRKRLARLAAVLICLNPIGSWAFTSILETIYRAQESVVEIRIRGAGLFKDQAAGAAKGLKVVQYEKNGTGVIIDPEGLVITNAHIVDSKGAIEIIFNDNTKHAGKLVAVSAGEDLAMIRILGPGPYPALEFAEDAYIRLRQKVYTIGGSDYTDNTISEGRITAIAESASKIKYAGSPEGIIQASFNIYQGDSGSPLLDDGGRLLGIMAASRARQNKIAYAIPCTTIKSFIQRVGQEQKNHSQ